MLEVLFDEPFFFFNLLLELRSENFEPRQTFEIFTDIARIVLFQLFVLTA